MAVGVWCCCWCQHPWIKRNDDELSSRDLSSSLDEMRSFEGRRKFKAAAKAVSGGRSPRTEQQAALMTVDADP
jgi:hypothetical protein